MPPTMHPFESGPISEKSADQPRQTQLTRPPKTMGGCGRSGEGELGRCRAGPVLAPTFALK